MIITNDVGKCRRNSSNFLFNLNNNFDKFKFRFKLLLEGFSSIQRIFSLLSQYFQNWGYFILANISHEVLNYLKENLGNENVREDMNIKNDLGLTSLDLVDLAFYLEQRIDRTVTDEELLSLKTVKDVINFVANNVDEKELTK